MFFKSCCPGRWWSPILGDAQNPFGHNFRQAGLDLPASLSLWFSAAGFPHTLFASPFFHITISFLPPAKTLWTWRKHTFLFPNFVLKNSSFEKSILTFTVLATCKGKIKRTLWKSRKDIEQRSTLQKTPHKTNSSCYETRHVAEICASTCLRDVLFSSIPLVFLLEKLSGHPWAICPSENGVFS